MTSQTIETNDDEAIRAEIEKRVRAVRAKDVDGLMAGYSPEVATFDIVAPLANWGLNAVRKRVVDWFSSFETAIDYEIRNVNLEVAGDVAFEHHFTHVHGTNKAGSVIDMWFRETVGYRKTEGRWKVTHQHSSVPFDMASGKPLLELRP
jgi:ketosteroid isomerase-like protein